MFLAALPLADEPGGDVEVASKHSLARLLAQADLPDLRCKEKRAFPDSLRRRIRISPIGWKP
jgi:hypothetical protein